MITAKQAEKLRKHDCLIHMYKFYKHELNKISGSLQSAVKERRARITRTYKNLSRGEYDMLKDICADYTEMGYATWIEDKGKNSKGVHIYQFFLDI